MTQKKYKTALAEIMEQIKLNYKPQKIHSIATLIKQCAAIDKDSKELFNQCKTLDRYYIPPRYPVPYTVNYRRQDAKEAIEISESTTAIVFRLLK